MKHSVGTMDGAKANVYDGVTRQFAMQIGQKGEETICEDAVATCKMKVKTFKAKKEKDKMKACFDNKGKVFSSILGKCDDAAITRLENVKEHKAAEEGGDVAVLKGPAKKLASGASV